MSDVDAALFVREHARPGRAPLVPEIELLLATEVTPLWHATEPWLRDRGVPPPFWAFAWAGGQALARFVLDGGVSVAGLRVLDFACGGGIVAIAAAMRGARVLGVDVDPFAAAATRLAAERNGVTLEVRVEDCVERAPPGAPQIVLCGDVFYDRAMATRVEPWLRGLARAGVDVLVGDPERAYVPSSDVERLASYEVETPLDLESSERKRTHVLRIKAI